MAFYENTIVAKQDLAEKDLKILKDKYDEIINKSSRASITLPSQKYVYQNFIRVM